MLLPYKSHPQFPATLSHPYPTPFLTTHKRKKPKKKNTTPSTPSTPSKPPPKKGQKTPQGPPAPNPRPVTSRVTHTRIENKSQPSEQRKEPTSPHRGNIEHRALSRGTAQGGMSNTGPLSRNTTVVNSSSWKGKKRSLEKERRPADGRF